MADIFHSPRRGHSSGDGGRRGGPAILTFGVCLALLFFSGCASEVFAPDAAPEYVIVRDFSPFYRLGPQQARGPDVSMSAQTRVKLLRREMGFSLVLLEDGHTGYVANEDMAVAPPRPPSAGENALADDPPPAVQNFPPMDLSGNPEIAPAPSQANAPEETPSPGSERR